MKILACIPFHYYDTVSLTFSYYYVVDTLRRMGHDVHVFEFIEHAAVNKDGMNDFFLAAVRKIGYDLVFVETSRDEFYPEVLDEARKHSVTLAWNSDDDWRWESYSRHWVSHYTYMVTTYKHIYEPNRAKWPNLLLSQWGCTGLFDGGDTKKTIPFSFVGGIHGVRAHQLQAIKARMSIEVFSKTPLPPKSRARRAMRQLAGLAYGAPLAAEGHRLDYEQVNDVWNRSKISLAPLEASQGTGLQVKGRVFEMGCSGTVMLCTRNPDLYGYYEPGTEFMEYDSVDDCCAKARYLLQHDTERLRMAAAYYKRTRAEHMWAHRYAELFRAIGFV